MPMVCAGIEEELTVIDKQVYLGLNVTWKNWKLTSQQQ